MAVEKGTLVTNKVRLVRLLGEGGMGSVWVAHHEALDTEVAVKFVSVELAERDETILPRFKREAALSAKIQSPHAVKTFDHGVMDDGHPYIVMELLRGETLGERLTREKRLSPQEVSVVMGQVAQVLDEAHGLGVMHRDIKPDNIFLIESGYELFVKVLDFGIAKQTSPGVSGVTDTGSVIGTPEYMSPEQLLSPKSADYRADLWSLAVLAYHALTGRVPFSGQTLPSLSIEICGGRFVLPSQIIHELPPELDEWFERALAPELDVRFEQVLEMAESFRSIVRNSSVPGDMMASRGGKQINEDLEPLSSERRKSGSAVSSGNPVSSDVSSGRDTTVDSERQPGDSQPGESSDSNRAPRHQRLPEGGGTLASALSEREPARASRPPAIRVIEARTTTSRRVEDFAADDSGEQNAISGSGTQGVSPTFSGSSSNLAPESEEDDPSSGKFVRLAVIAGAAVVAFVMHSLLSSPEPSTAAPSATTEAPPPTAAATSAADKAESESVTPPSSAEPAAQPSASASASADASTASSHHAAKGRVPTANRPKRPTRPPATAKSSAKPGCENAYVVNADGTVSVKPECL